MGTLSPQLRTLLDLEVFRTAHNSFFDLLADHWCFLVAVLRLRPALIRASRVLPSTPPLFHRVERHFLLGQFGGFSVSGIHLWPQTSQTATRIVFQPMQPLYRILPIGHYMVDVWASPLV
jgi:hypothetical protein